MLFINPEFWTSSLLPSFPLSSMLWVPLNAEIVVLLNLKSLATALAPVKSVEAEKNADEL